MQISDESLEELRQLYKEEHNEEITIGEAREIAGSLLTMIELVSRRLPDEIEAVLSAKKSAEKKKS
ncbi:hypothetical protein A2671_02595 [Candidatus Kaiserbacteria bacterium RIFCSPHIGHO2_01_FULL_49_13]|uniref:Uncharacterized protein n=1 Tax=Candidatus Kaiserbacteria bacterium RIFCSPHIGHO2_01_FULL_49_13 TaxID=1798477 RepID=A0A1F6CCQ2_9BACT|nr:MAG: hypothetical protein A2671_02595 [Candidatus Kaiserbacteria bacterium RIFCSPHIGHO2_01_FULL_49_13]